MQQSWLTCRYGYRYTLSGDKHTTPRLPLRAAGNGRPPCGERGTLQPLQHKTNTHIEKEGWGGGGSVLDNIEQDR